MVWLTKPSTGQVGELGIKWGPAGVAPQTVEDAIRDLQLDNNGANNLSKQNILPGDDRVIGWIIGSNSSERDGVIVTIGKVPSGTCVDFDPGSSQVNGSVVGSVDFSSKWRRVLMSENGSASGLKFTMYWTPCELGNRAQPATRATAVRQPTPHPQATAVTKNVCTDPSRWGGDPSEWKDALGPAKGFGFVYGKDDGSSPEAVLRAPSFGRIDGDGWVLRKGDTGEKSGVVATWWCEG